MQRIIVTGGLGFIGSNLVNMLSNQFDILVIDSGSIGYNNRRFLDVNYKYLEFDLRDKSQLIKVIRENDIVVHLAAKGNVVESVADPYSNFQSNVLSTVTLLEVMRKNNCNKLVFASTGGALMGNAIPPVDESTCPKPISPYGSSKLACEAYISSYSFSYGIQSIVLRFGNVYGQFSLHKKGVINKFINNSIKDITSIVYDSTHTTRDYIHVTDICYGIYLSIKELTNETNLNQTFHLSNGIEVSIADIIKNIEIASSKPFKFDYGPPRIGEVVRNCSNFSLAKSALGFEPKVTLHEGILDLYNWLLKNN